ncbi:MAG: hypothetical protein ACC652_13360 [Acidimicrobiales bacterium]
MTAQVDDMIPEQEPFIDHATTILLAKAARILVFFVYAIVLISFVFLTLAFLLRLAGANPSSGFVEWVYRNANRSMDPFRGIFPTEELSGKSVFDASLLFASVFYGFVALFLHAGVSWASGWIRRTEYKQARQAMQSNEVQSIPPQY